MTSKMSGKNQNMAPMWKKLMKNVEIDEPTSFLDHMYLGCTQSDCKPNDVIIERYTKMFESRICAGATEKLPGWQKTRIGRPDIMWPVNKLARSVTKWTHACDKRLARLISYIHHTNDYRQYCHVGNTAQHCRLGLFQDSDFAGDLEDSKSTSGGVLCILGSRTFVPVSWTCKKQASFSHSSRESEVIYLDAGLRMDGLPALDLWDAVI